MKIQGSAPTRHIPNPSATLKKKKKQTPFRRACCAARDDARAPRQLELTHPRGAVPSLSSTQPLSPSPNLHSASIPLVTAADVVNAGKVPPANAWIRRAFGEGVSVSADIVEKALSQAKEHFTRGADG